MTALNLDKTSSEASAANAPAHSNKWAASRAARRLASSPVSLYLWLSGPPLTELDRARANLAYAEGAQGRRGLVA